MEDSVEIVLPVARMDGWHEKGRKGQEARCSRFTGSRVERGRGESEKSWARNVESRRASGEKPLIRKNPETETQEPYIKCLISLREESSGSENGRGQVLYGLEAEGQPRPDLSSPSWSSCLHYTLLTVLFRAVMQRKRPEKPSASDLGPLRPTRVQLESKVPRRARAMWSSKAGTGPIADFDLNDLKGCAPGISRVNAERREKGVMSLSLVPIFHPHRDHGTCTSFCSYGVTPSP